MSKPTIEQKIDAQSVELGIGYLAVKLRQEAMGMRISTMSRYRDLIRRKVENIPFNKVEAKKSDDDKKKDTDKFKDSELPKYLAQLKKEKRLTKLEMKRINTALDMIGDIKALEQRATKDLINPYILHEEMYYAYYKHIKGIGPVMTAELMNIGMRSTGIKEDGTEMCPHISSLRKYCMMDPDGARGRTSGQKLEGNLKAKTLWWKVAAQMMMAKNPIFMRLYNGEKDRQTKLMEACKCHNCGKGPDAHSISKAKYKDTKYHCKNAMLYAPDNLSAPRSKLHAHRRAIRSTIQKFITWHWIIDRQLAGFPTDQG